MIHTPTAISIFVCLSMVQLMAVFISMRCTLCGHFLQVALTLILVVGYAIARSEERFSRNAETDLVCRLLLEKKYVNLSRFFIDRPIFAGVLSVLMFLGGLIALRFLPIPVYPEVVPPSV